MKNRIFIKLTAILLSLGLCGCTTLSDVGTVNQATADFEDYGFTSSDTSATSSDATGMSGLYFDPETGELKTENSDIYSLVGDAKSTIDDEYKEGVPDDVGAALTTQLAVDHDKLWDVEGNPAFYIPDYHSAKAEDLKSFVLLELCDDGKSVIYSYETAYYGDVLKPLNGIARVGTAKKNHTHINWKVPDKEKDNKDYKPDTNLEVYCFMRYNTETREYRIYDVRLGLASDSSKDSDGGSSVSDEALVNTLKEYDPGKRRMFAGKSYDKFNRFTGGYLYYSMYDMHYTLMDANGNIQRQTDATTLVSEGINNYVKQNIVKTYADKHNKKLDDYFKECSITYSTANCNITVAGGLLMEMNVNVTMPDEEEKEPYSVFCNYAMFSNKSSGEDPTLISENLSLASQTESKTDDSASTTNNNQSRNSQSTGGQNTSSQGTGSKSAVSQSTSGQDTGTQMSWFSLTDAPSQKLIAIKLAGSDIFDKNKNTNADTYFGYLNTLVKRYMELYKEDANESTLNNLWNEAYKDVSGNDNTAKNYSTVMKTVERPIIVTGNNLEDIINQHNESGNMRFGLVNTKVDTTNTQNVVSLSLYRSGSTRIEIAEYKYADLDTDSDSDSDSESGSDSDSASGSSDESSDASGDEEESVLQSVTIKIKENGSSVDLFDVMGAASDLALSVSDEGNVIYYWVRTSGDDKNTTKILMPFGSDDTSTKYCGSTVIKDLAGSVTFLKDQTDSNNLHNWVVAALGDEGVWILRCKSMDLGLQKDPYQWESSFQIPYMMTVTPSNEIGETTVMTYKGADDKDVTKKIGQKASLTGRNTIAYEEVSGSSYGKYRFTTLQSGILVYDPSNKTTVVADSGQYYGSWKASDGSYTAIGFNSRVQDAGFEDIMKAKIYHGLKPSEEDLFLLTLKERLKVDTDLQKRFLKVPDGWKDVCKEYNFNPDLYPKKKIETYAKRLISINNAYDAALQEFWTILKFVPTDKEKTTIESRFYYCTSESAMDQLIKDTMEEYLKTDDVIAETEDIFSGGKTKIVDDGWIYKVQESQRKAMDKKAKQEYIKTITGDTDDTEWQNTLKELYTAVTNKRNMWNY